MAYVRIVPGAVTARRLRALLLGRGEGLPRITATPAAGGPAVPGAVGDVPIEHPGVAHELRRNQVRLFEAELDGLVPDAVYSVRATLGDASFDMRVRALEEAATGRALTVVVGSCYFDGFGSDAAYLATLNSTYCKDAAFKLLIGDNLYADVPFGDVVGGGSDEETVARYVRYFWSSRYANVLSRLPTLTTWDDHEFWNNYPQWVPWLTRTLPWNRGAWRRAGQACVDAFQATLNPRPAVADVRSYRFEDAPCVSFYVADLRSQRDTHDDDRSRMMPEAALADLEAWARTLSRPGVLVIGQPLWIEPGSQFTDYNPPTFGRQYERIWRALAEAPWDVAVVSGDVHHSRLLTIAAQYQTAQGWVTTRNVPEVVTSPACHIPPVIDAVVRTNDRQGRSEVKVPAAVPLRNTRVPYLRPGLVDYAFGTSAPNALAALRFTRLASGQVSVGVTFLDTRTQRPPSSEPLRVEGHRPWSPRTATCHEEESFRLGRRFES